MTDLGLSHSSHVAQDPAAEIAALRISYQESRAKIDALENSVDREIGLADFRLEAGETLRSLRSNGVGLTEIDLEPLTSYVSTLSGGETVELLLGEVNQKARRLILDIVVSSVTGAVFWGTTVLIILGLAADWLTEAGATVANGIGILLPLIPITGGVIYGVLCAIRAAGPAIVDHTQRASEGTFRWAESLGSQAEPAMKPPREQSRHLLTSCGVRPLRTGKITGQAQGWAKATIIFAHFALLFAFLFFMDGFLTALGISL